MDLLIITHTAEHRPEALARCQASVASMLPEGARHIVMIVPGVEFLVPARMAAIYTNPGKLVCFVDDDDIVINDSLRICKAAHEANDVGFVFTDEQMTRKLDGKTLANNSGVRTYEDLLDNPRRFHHLTMYRTDYVPKYHLGLHEEQSGTGIEFLLKAGAGLSHGALHVPIIGYDWTLDPTSLSAPKSKKPKFDHLLHEAFSLEGNRTGPVPTYEVPA